METRNGRKVTSNLERGLAIWIFSGVSICREEEEEESGLALILEVALIFVREWR